MNINYDVEKLRVIIPVGGRAKRLLPLTAEVSKAVIRLVNRPLIEVSLLCLARQGIKNFIFGVKGYTNYCSIHDYFKSGVGFSARYNVTPRIHIKYQPNWEDYGSADSAKINMEYYDVVDPIFAVQGDNIFDINIREFLDFHKKKNAVMTIGLRRVEDVEGYGIADINKDGRISKFVEKPNIDEAPSRLANTGIYLVTPEIRGIFREKEVKRMVRTKKRLDFGYDMIPYLIETGRPVYGYTLKGSWYDVGTPKRYLEAMREILGGKLHSLKVFEEKVYNDTPVWVQGRSRESIERRSVIMGKIRRGEITLEGPALIGRHCEIGNNVRLVNSCVDNYSRVGDNVSIENSAIMDRVTIGKGAEIRNSIIGRHTTVKSELANKTVIDDFSVVADDVVVEAGCKLSSTKVFPHIYVAKAEYVGATLPHKPTQT